MKKFISFLVVLVFSTLAHAEYTVRDNVIKVVIPQPPNSGLGMLYRHIEMYANKQNIKMMPVFKPGAEGKIGIEYASKEKNDGNTLLLSTVSDYVIVNNLDFEAVAPITKIDMVLVASKKSKIKNINDIVKQEKENPGKLTWAYMSTAQEVYINNFAKANNIDTNKIYKVPFRTGGIAQSLMNGDVDLTLVPPTLLPSLIEHLTVVDFDEATERKMAEKENATGLFLPKNSSNDSNKFWNRFINDLLNDEEFKSSMKTVKARTFTNATSNELISVINNWK
jgi:tripartite-type tricarboxylate transporter receptor subunit TctC